MSEILKGNFTTKRDVKVEENKDEIEERFEREAMKHLGGSIAFVAKKRVKWDASES